MDTVLQILGAVVILPAAICGVVGLFIAYIREKPLVKGLWVGALAGAAGGALWVLITSNWPF